jgi:hypothetical protein
VQTAILRGADYFLNDLFARSSPCITPAMAAGVSNTLWSLEEAVEETCR